MLLWKELKNQIDEYIADQVMTTIWPQTCEDDENHILRRVCDHQAHTANEIRKNVNQISFETLADLENVGNALEDRYDQTYSDDSDFYDDYPNLARVTDKALYDGINLAVIMYDEIKQSAEPITDGSEILDKLDSKLTVEDF